MKLLYLPTKLQPKYLTTQMTVDYRKSYASLGGYTLVTLPRIVTPYRDSVDGTRDRVTYQKLVTR